MRLPKAGTCSATAGQVREVICPADTWGLFVEQAGATAGTLFATPSRADVAYADEAASPTLVLAGDGYVIPVGESLTVYLGPPTGAPGTTRSVFISSDTASATFKASPLGVEVMR